MEALEKVDGMTLEQMEFVFTRLRDAVTICCNQDERQRHVVLVIVTRDPADVDEDGIPMVTTDVISTMDIEGVHETMRDWLHRKTQ